MQIRACHYDDNTDILTVIGAEGIIYHYPCYEIENSIEMLPEARSYLRWMKEKEPYTFAELVIQGDLKQFAKGYSREYLKQQNDLEDQLTIHFQDKTYAQAIAREMMMYRD
ncbi:DUF6061 family protein [Paenibacillus farraposensis]|uniref:DUF6061 family protein n=1 Tax=Paenibacillus farraposensis TaxID=2807095 RepID=A0ABW4DAI4_9BACL|nr:DUF6061 family protein [Paenibacillus farraposensis]MCC3381773.1 hypothetical protein [Paenibacillus farraposensis]